MQGIFRIGLLPCDFIELISSNSFGRDLLVC